MKPLSEITEIPNLLISATGIDGGCGALYLNGVRAEPMIVVRWIFKSRNKLINTGKLFVSSRIYTPKSLPTSEFCEIPRGRYFFKKEHRTIQIPFCSKCGNRGGDNEYDISKYCPICGARMDGDKT